MISQVAKGNIIYYTDNYTNHLWEGEKGGNDIRVIDLGDGSVRPMPGWTRTDDSAVWPPPVWVTPIPFS